MRRLSLLASLAVTLVLASCGGDTTSPPTTGSAQATTTTTSAAGATTTRAGGGATTTTAAGATGAKGEVGQACTFVTESDAQAELGGPVEKIDRNKDCRYELNGDFDRRIQITVARFPHGGYDDAAEVKAQLDSSTNNFEKIPGLGDGAWFSRVIPAITVVKGDVYINVQPVITDTSADLNPATDRSKEKDVATRLATLILARL